MSDTLPKSLYDCLEHPKNCAEDDFWGQVRRTLHGKPVPQEQIDLIFAMIRQGLQFRPEDVLLDICCGNGRLGSEFFGEIKAYLGVDLSPCLIDIGRRHFQRLPDYAFTQRSINDYCREEPNPGRFTKALWYGAIAYLPEQDVREVFALLHERFTLEALFVGSIPNRDCAALFFNGNPSFSLDDHTTAIGRWYTRAAFTRLAEDCGWHVALPPIPENFYQASYRFNAILTPKASL